MTTNRPERIIPPPKETSTYEQLQMEAAAHMSVAQHLYSKALTQQAGAKVMRDAGGSGVWEMLEAVFTMQRAAVEQGAAKLCQEHMNTFSLAFILSAIAAATGDDEDDEIEPGGIPA